jgi:transposase-like protein
MGVVWALRGVKMPRPYSVDLRERALLACEADEGDFTAVARRFRVGVSTLRLWRRQAREEGRRAPLRMGRGPAPLGGKLEALNQLVTERNDATLAEYADLVCGPLGRAHGRAGQRARDLPGAEAAGLGWVLRKQRRSGPANRIVWTWQPVASRGGATKRPGSTRPVSCSSTRAASTRG